MLLAISDWTIHREVCKSWARGAVPWAPKAITIFGCDNLKPHAEVPALESMQRVPTPARHALALWRFPVEAAVGMPANNMSEALRTFFGGGFRDVLHGPAVVTAVPIGSHMDVHDMLWVERTCLRESARLAARPQPVHIAAPATPATPVSATPLFATAASVAPLADAPAADAKDIVVAGAHLADAECEVLRQAKLERAREGAARLALAQRRALSGGATTAGSPVGACADARCHHSQVLDSAPYVRAHCSVCVVSPRLISILSVYPPQANARGRKSACTIIRAAGARTSALRRCTARWAPSPPAPQRGAGASPPMPGWWTVAPRVSSIKPTPPRRPPRSRPRWPSSAAANPRNTPRPRSQPLPPSTARTTVTTTTTTTKRTGAKARAK